MARGRGYSSAKEDLVRRDYSICDKASSGFVVNREYGAKYVVVVLYDHLGLSTAESVIYQTRAISGQSQFHYA